MPSVWRAADINKETGRHEPSTLIRGSFSASGGGTTHPVADICEHIQQKGLGDAAVEAGQTGGPGGRCSCCFWMLQLNSGSGGPVDQVGGNMHIWMNLVYRGIPGVERELYFSVG